MNEHVFQTIESVCMYMITQQHYKSEQFLNSEIFTIRNFLTILNKEKILFDFSLLRYDTETSDERVYKNIYFYSRHSQELPTNWITFEYEFFV